MMFLAPVALLALAVPLAIYVVHWLFGSRRRVRVPAIFLWAELPQAPTGRSRRRRPPFSLLLLLQLLAATLAALALARPVASSDPPRHLALEQLPVLRCFEQTQRAVHCRGSNPQQPARRSCLRGKLG